MTKAAGFLSGLTSQPLQDQGKAQRTEARHQLAFSYQVQKQREQKEETKYFMEQLEMPTIEQPFLAKQFEEYSKGMVEEAGQLMHKGDLLKNPENWAKFNSVRGKLMNNEITAKSKQLTQTLQMINENKEKLPSYEINRMMKSVNSYANTGQWTDEDGNVQKTVPQFDGVSVSELYDEMMSFTTGNITPKQIKNPETGVLDIVQSLDYAGALKSVKTWASTNPKNVEMVLARGNQAAIANHPDGAAGYLADVAMSRSAMKMSTQVDQKAKDDRADARSQADRAAANYRWQKTFDQNKINAANTLAAKGQDNLYKQWEVNKKNAEDMNKVGSLENILPGMASVASTSSITAGGLDIPLKNLNVQYNLKNPNSPIRINDYKALDSNMKFLRAEVQIPKEELEDALINMSGEDFDHMVEGVGGRSLKDYLRNRRVSNFKEDRDRATAQQIIGEMVNAGHLVSDGDNFIGTLNISADALGKHPGAVDWNEKRLKLYNLEKEYGEAFMTSTYIPEEEDKTSKNKGSKNPVEGR